MAGTPQAALFTSNEKNHSDDQQFLSLYLTKANFSRCNWMNTKGRIINFRITLSIHLEVCEV
jgi:hypothetical protein